MNEYKVTVKTWYTGGFLPDLFGTTHPIAYEKAESAGEVYSKYKQMMETHFRFSPIIYKIDVQKV